MKHVLLIDDDAVVAAAYQIKLQKLGYNVSIAGDGESALKMLGELEPDIMLLDLMLPDINGVDVVKRMRAQGSRVPVVVLTNAYALKNIQTVLAAGASSCLPKSICSPEVLERTLRTVLESKKARVELREQMIPAPRELLQLRPQIAPPDHHKETSTVLKEMRAELRLLIKETEPKRTEVLHSLFRKARAIASTAGLAGLSSFADVAAGLENFLSELFEKPEKATVSAQRTVAAAIDLLGELLESGDSVFKSRESVCALVVEDDAIARRAVKRSLEIVKVNSVEVDSAEAALELLPDRTFDLAILDVQLPGMDGADFCKAMRRVPGHERTPTVFVTNADDFQTRARSTLSGGNDFIAKPFSFGELALKALMWIYRSKNTLLKGRKIALIGDDPSFITAYIDFLEKNGAKARTTDGTEDGFYLVQSFKPDVLIVNVDSKDHRSVELLKKFRAQKQFQQMKVVAYAENAQPFQAMLKELEPFALLDREALTPSKLLEILQSNTPIKA